jgi:hypothetical protein
MNTKDIYLEAILTFGVNNQREMMIEECSEITQAIQKLKRFEDAAKKGIVNNKNVSVQKKHKLLQKEFIKELVDVEIVLIQLKKVIDLDIYTNAKDFKLKRLASLIKDEKNRKKGISKKSGRNKDENINSDDFTVNKLRNGKITKKIKRPNHIRNQMIRLSEKEKKS